MPTRYRCHGATSRSRRGLVVRTASQPVGEKACSGLAPELIAIQESSDQWENRERLVKLAKSMGERGVQMTRLEFPRTEIQLFGDTAILYYTYIMEQKLGANTAVSAGRGMEAFVRRKGRWVDVGWHLDNGAFQQKDGGWIRVGEPVSAPSH